ncbi:MAG: LamG domain-containing protein [Bacteroidales bacterium]|nr:LamG domain-containing protein [Bacteroidales bacterium]
MSRRHNILTGEDLPPFSENLVFWAPLTQGDLTDHVSGVTLSVPYGSVTWDAGSQGYKIYGPNSAKKYVGAWMNLSLGFDITNLGYTLSFELYSWSAVWIIPACLGGRTFAQNVNIGATNNTWQRITNVLEPYDGVNVHYSHQYLNGVDKFPYSRGTSPVAGNSSTNLQVELNTRGDNNLNYTYVMRNITIYNRALSASEVAQL